MHPTAVSTSKWCVQPCPSTSPLRGYAQDEREEASRFHAPTQRRHGTTQSCRGTLATTLRANGNFAAYGTRMTVPNCSKCVSNAKACVILKRSMTTLLVQSVKLHSLSL